VKHRIDDRQGLVADALQLGISLDPSQAERLIEFERLLVDRAIPAGIVARSDAPRIRERHLLDCLRASPVPGRGDRCYDLGSGGGLPGLVVAIARPDLRISLVERRARRVAFLELALEVLAPGNAEVVPTPLEELEGPADVCFSRALGPLGRVWASARPLLRPGGRLVYFAGREPVAVEIPEDAVLVAELAHPVLESAGPLVIMARQ
jgi:16S rRNA (guanine527-N7)-methyltransferase